MITIECQYEFTSGRGQLLYIYVASYQRKYINFGQLIKIEGSTVCIYDAYNCDHMQFKTPTRWFRKQSTNGQH